MRGHKFKDAFDFTLLAGIRVIIFVKDNSLVTSLSDYLKNYNIDVIVPVNLDELRNLVLETHVDVLVVAHDLGEITALEFLNEFTGKNVLPPIIVIVSSTQQMTTSLLSKYFAAGVVDIMILPFHPFNLLVKISRIYTRHVLEERVEYYKSKESILQKELIGESPAIVAVREFIKKVAPYDIPVLIRGESGVGKELVARAIHKLSKRARHAFIAINCAAIPETLLESELFGFVKGAFTGATYSKVGLLKVAHRGTLLLDEIGDAPISIQVKLLRVIETGEFFPLGQERPSKVDVRILASTNKDLESAINRGEFRSELYYRLQTAEIFIPPLRERKEDIPLLAWHFLKLANEEMNKSVSLSPGVIDVFVKYHWPGNVRELKNVIYGLVALADPCSIVSPKALPERLRILSKSSKFKLSYKEEKKRVLESFERQYFNYVLSRTKGNVSKAAKLAGLDRSWFIYKLKKYGIDPSVYKF